MLELPVGCFYRFIRVYIDLSEGQLQAASVALHLEAL
jgi:hypothetical protein